MSERQRHGAPDDRSPQHLDAEAIATALNTSSEERQDVAYGAGIGFRVGKEQRTNLEIYPAASVARLTTAQARIELFRQPAPITQPEGVLFEQRSAEQGLSLSLTPDGAVTLAVTPTRHETSSEATIEPSAPYSTTIQTRVPSEQPNAVLVHPEASERPSSDQSPSAEAPDKEEKRRVNLTGRVGATPAFRTTPKGVFIGRFPLAVRDEDEQTHWHSILTFNERARKLQDAKLAKGQLVGVTGYIHEREQPTRGGEKKLVEEIYAVVIKLR